MINPAVHPTHIEVPRVWLDLFDDLARMFPFWFKKAKSPSVLVVIVYTDYKEYAKWLIHRVFDSLIYPNKTLLLVHEEKFPHIAQPATGEERAAAGRQVGIDYAREYKFDYILFLDCDLEPPVDVIEQLLECGSDIAGGATAARGDANNCIGHNYNNHRERVRRPISRSEAVGIHSVDGIGGCCVLISRRIFSEVDYEGYCGPDTIAGRFTADDEYYQIKAHDRFGVTPRVNFDCMPWHYDSNGYAYKLWGKKKYWKVAPETAFGFNK